ncbi:MAG: metallophosphoesterase [Bacteroidota bacterium]
MYSYFKHLLLTLIILIPTLIAIGLYHGASAHYGDNPLAMDWEQDGPYLFYTSDSLVSVNYVRGNGEDGFTVETHEYPQDSSFTLTSYFALDSSNFTFPIDHHFQVPSVVYEDNAPILAISDIESGYRTFRDFLIQHGVIDQALNWVFGQGHLVLVGDFVDRGFSTTQVLWFIYKLEQAAQKSGGHVHFIIGNHELKNLQGFYESASPKYYYVAAIMGKQQYEIYNPTSFFGRWLSSKNAVELINGQLFVHGGLHPDIAKEKLDLNTINRTIRAGYHQAYFPRSGAKTETLLQSSKSGLCWYRGYFKENLSQEQINQTLEHFGAETIVVGHTIQFKVNRQFEGKVIAIDVQHPKDYQKNWPVRKSEGLLIDNGKYYRLLANGKRKVL